MRGSGVIFIVAIIIDALVEERVRNETCNWHYAFLAAPCLQLIPAAISLYAAAVAFHRRRKAWLTVMGTVLVLLGTAMIVDVGWSAFRRYSWVIVH